VGQRHDKPIVLTIQAQRMQERGFQFHRSGGAVWLTKEVPAEYIVLPQH